MIWTSYNENFSSDAYDFFTEDAFDAIKQSLAEDIGEAGLTAVLAVIKPLKILKKASGLILKLDITLHV